MKNYLGILFLLLCVNAFAATSKWVDENGKVHYSDKPPPSNVESTVLRPISSPVTDDKVAPEDESSSAPKSVFERLADLKKQQQEKQEATKKVKQAQAKADAIKVHCDAVKRELRTMQNGIRIVEVDVDGERSYISDGQRQQRIAKAESDITEFCN